LLVVLQLFLQNSLIRYEHNMILATDHLSRQLSLGSVHSLTATVLS